MNEYWISGLTVSMWRFDEYRVFGLDQLSTGYSIQIENRISVIIHESFPRIFYLVIFSLILVLVSLIVYLLVLLWSGIYILPGFRTLPQPQFGNLFSPPPFFGCLYHLFSLPSPPPLILISFRFPCYYSFFFIFPDFVKSPSVYLIYF